MMCTQWNMSSVESLRLLLHLQATLDIPGFVRRRSSEIAADLQLRTHYTGEVKGMMMVYDMVTKSTDPTGKNVHVCVCGGGGVYISKCG